MSGILRSAALRRWSWLAIVALVVVALVRNAVDDGPPRSTPDRVQAIAATLKCPVCESQSVADSEVAAARSIRAEIERRIEAGEDDDAIRDAIAAAYGEDVLLTPSGSGFAGLVWILPVVALVLALAALTATFARWRHRATTSASDEDRALVEGALRDR